MAVGSCAKRRFAENDRHDEETPSSSGSFSERLLVWICDRNACAVCDHHAKNAAAARSRLFIAVTGHQGLGLMRTSVTNRFAKDDRISVRHQ
jgi:hypothetical protein